MNDPGLAPVTVTEVSVKDLRIAHVITPPSWRRRSAGRGQALRRSSGFLRRELGHLLGLRYAPELQFHYDDSFDRGARIDAILRDIPEGKEGPGEG